MTQQSIADELIDAAIQLNWKSPPAAERGDESPDPIHLEVGRSLSQWEIMEVALGQTYQTMCQGRYSEGLMNAASRTYGPITSPMVRRSVLTEVAELYSVFVDPEFELAKFKRLLQNYGNASAFRNNLAHGYVLQINVEDQSHGHYLAPAAYITKRNLRVDQWEAFKSSAPKPEFPSLTYLYNASDIKEIRAQFEVLSKACNAFCGLLISKSVQISFERAKAIAEAPPVQIRVISSP